MDYMYATSLFIFRRDLRLYDNTALQEACKQSRVVIPCFIFDAQQVGHENTYRSMNAIQYMIEALGDLHQQLKKHKGSLYYLYGDPAKELEHLIIDTGAEAVFLNKDYTPFSLKRDEALQKVCDKKAVVLHSYDDVLLNSPSSVVKADGGVYSVFTAFYKKSCLIPVHKPQQLKQSSWYTKKLKRALSVAEVKKKILGSYNNKACAVRGGRERGLAVLSAISDYKLYEKTRDIPSQETTHLSAHLKFGVISIREAFHAIKGALGGHHSLLRQLYWRDFWTYIAYHNPHVFGQAYHKRYDKIVWNPNKELFTKWCKGETGFPIVDAGMRELNATGFMHNRVRMIVASFLTKDLHIDWRWGERYFAQQLVDYDPSVNNGNWQWSASTGCDAQPYFRIFNPWLQQKKFDLACIYIKRWIPELASTDVRTIHAMYKYHIAGYPKPCIDHGIESVKAKNLYKKIK